MKYPKIPLAQTVVQLCKLKDIEHIVISPGSRNAPLTIGFTNDSFFKCYSIVDERCAAFFGLGMAQQIKKPVALVCTSGSALLNYYPAIAEAYYSNISLVVLSADRPEHLINVGDGQTINQKNIFENHIFYSASLKSDIEDQNQVKINEAINIALYKRGPVHINIPFNEPLYEVVDKLCINPKVDEVQLKANTIDDILLDELVAEWNNAKRKMILVGVNAPDVVEQKWLEKIADNESVIVFTETTSNLHHSDFFPCIDKIIAPLSESEFLGLQPDVLVTFGGLIVSKKIKAFLREYKPKHHWHIDEQKANDTFFCLDHHIKSTPNQFFPNFFEKVTDVSISSNYQKLWNKVKWHREQKHIDYLNTIPFSDLIAFSIVLETIPNNSILQLANSATIRYAQLFEIDETIEVYCNRGTSGIDGSTSTAVGCAMISEKQTTFITGDLSFFYDSNALWNNYIPTNFRIILINNGGGGIFRILPGNKNTENFDTFFETKHNLTSEQLCKMYGFEYSTANSIDCLTEGLSELFENSNAPKLLEIFTPSTINDEVLLNYFKFIK